MAYEAVDGVRFRDQDVPVGGVSGENIEIPSANPVNYYQVIQAPGSCEPITIDGKLYLPADRGDRRHAVVIMVPGSLGVGPNHVAHAETLVTAGFGCFVLDPFGARAVASTVENQTHYSFAASAFDVLATLRVLQDDPRVDVARIGAQGHSRGGAAVITAAMRAFADPIVGDAELAAVYAVYPWCGHQFEHPRIGDTRLRAIIGDQDDWLSVQQVQAQVNGIRLTGGDATFQLVGGAAHSFDRPEQVHEIPEASVTPGAPTVYIDDSGALVDPWTGQASSDLTDRDLFLTAVRAGFGRRGAHIGGEGDQPALFDADMVAFHRAVLGS